MIVLNIRRKKEQPQTEQTRTKKAMTAAGAAFLALGLVGVAVFGYLVFQSGGLNSLTGMADGIGLIVSLVVLVAGFYMK
jgi:hypothetical protein